MKLPKLHDGHRAALLILLVVLFTCIIGLLPSPSQAATWEVHHTPDEFTDEVAVFATAFTENERILSLACVVIDDKKGIRQPAFVDVNGWQPVAPILRKFRVDQNLHHEVYVERDGIAAVARVTQLPRLVREMFAGHKLKYQELTVYDREPPTDHVLLDGFKRAYREVDTACK